MESRSEHSSPEQQAWNTKYFTPPQPPGRTSPAEVASQEAAHPTGVTAVDIGLCARVREQLQSLLEEDGSVRPETATALYGHMAVCADCAREFDAMKRVVDMLEAMPYADLPADYSRLIMRRIETGEAPPKVTSAVQTAGLCDRVREKLQPLLDKDPEIRPEMAAALYGHLAVCPDCASEYDALRQMVNLLETMPAAELPIDYAPRIMQRIQSGSLTVPPVTEETTPRPTYAASSLAYGEVAAHETHRVTENLSVTRSSATQLSFWQRLIASVGLSGLFVYLLASDWGRQMLGVNLEAARIWLSQIGDHLQRVPILGVLIGSLGAALLSLDDALSHAFRAFGSAAAQTLAIEVSLGLAACLLVSGRRRYTITNTYPRT